VPAESTESVREDVATLKDDLAMARNGREENQ
jgi:hypothetical protein